MTVWPVTKRNWLKVLVTLTSIITLISCGEERPSTEVSRMLQTMDSLKMWYAKMEGDSMDAASMRIKVFLDQHPKDKSEPMRRLRAEWLTRDSRTAELYIQSGRWKR